MSSHPTQFIDPRRDASSPREVRRDPPTLRTWLHHGRERARWWKKMRYFLHDMRHTASHMFWDPRIRSYEKLSSELIFQFHKLEKGLCIPGKPRFFGKDPAIATCRLVARWREAALPQDDAVFIGALETLRAYRRRLALTPPAAADAEHLHALLDQALVDVPHAPEFTTPQPYATSDPAAVATLDRLCQQRRSVRAYAGEMPSLESIRDAIAVAQLSPSACNRQPCHVHVYRDRAQIDAMLELQNGNAGFGHTLSTLLVITADGNSFFDASERNEPFIDGGLFSMSLILALQARGLASCCLNWCVSPEKDVEAHRRGGIPSHHKIIMYMAVGLPMAGALAPKSARRHVDSVVHLHEPAAKAAAPDETTG